MFYVHFERACVVYVVVPSVLTFVFLTQVGYFVVEGTNDNATDNAAFVYGTKDGGKTWTRMLEEDGGGMACCCG